MAAPKRTKFDREHDYRRISEMYLKGWYQVDIAEAVGLSQGQVSLDLKAIRKRWREDTAFDIDEMKSRELERIDVLEKTYWESWERSLGERTKARQEVSGRNADGTPNVTKAVQEREERLGDPRFLTGVQWCITERCKLLGIYAEVKSKARVDVVNVRDLTDDELKQIVDGE